MKIDFIPERREFLCSQSRILGGKEYIACELVPEDIFKKGKYDIMLRLDQQHELAYEELNGGNKNLQPYKGE